jgi:hypothetical protein
MNPAAHEHDVIPSPVIPNGQVHVRDVPDGTHVADAKQPVSSEKVRSS